MTTVTTANVCINNQTLFVFMQALTRSGQKTLLTEGFDISMHFILPAKTSHHLVIDMMIEQARTFHYFTKSVSKGESEGQQ